jgi:triosephosphate isomerase (TIM)
MRKPLIAGNWKMNTTVAEAGVLVRELRGLVADSRGVEILVCPSYISLETVRRELDGSNIKIGAQNVHFAEKGAYTGEVSPLMLAGICKYVIIGHSERRQYFAEDGEIVNKKVIAAKKAGLKVILCIGEKLAENEAGQTQDVLRRQLDEALVDVAADNMVIAYEPVWAIGTGRAATSQQANDTIGFIRGRLAVKYDDALAQGIRILYGGSMNAANAAELMAEPEIDGGLIGGASLKARDFAAIVKAAAKSQ